MAGAISKPQNDPMGDFQKMLHKSMFSSGTFWWSASAIYFTYVVLGGISWKTHYHVYTGDENEPIFSRLKNGQVATFRKEVYEEFFFPSFLRYHNTYRVHVLMAGVWLLSGTYNLRNQPQFQGMKKVEGKVVASFSKNWLHTRLCGYIYVLSSILKGITASQMSIYSHSLGYARYPMVLFGIYDVFTCVAAYLYIINGDVAEHKRWMIRNFSVGAGSIFVRIFGGVWAAFDLGFMKSKSMYAKMNNIILVTGFASGAMFGEYWLAKTPSQRNRWSLGLLSTVLVTFFQARVIYKELADEEEKKKNSTKVTKLR